MLEEKKLDKNVPIPLYYQLKRLILEDIENGTYPIGSDIPTELQLSEMFDISRTTVRQAITELVQEGRLYRVKSKGTFVASDNNNQNIMSRLETYDGFVRHVGKTPKTQLISIEVESIPAKYADKLKMKRGEPSIHLCRLRFADEEPIVVLDTYLPYNLCGFVLEHDFNVESLYDTLALMENTKICRVSRSVEAIAATKADAELLKIKRGKPIHFIETIGYSKNNQPIEYSRAHYRGDQSCLDADIYFAPTMR